MLGTDSHTPNAGGLGTCAIGVGGADAVDAMANIPWELKAPKILGVHLTGQLSGWTSPKDVILKLAGLLTVSGGTGHIIEYFGPGAQTLSATGMATICNMGAEVGATTSLFPYSPNMAKYLIATRRPHVAAAADAALARGILKRDDGSDKQYDKIVEINLSELEPMLNGPFTPDAAIPISKVKDLIKEKGWKDEVKACLIGSCTNSSYQDMSRAASIAEQALAHNTPLAASFLITPGSEQIRATIARDGQSEILTKAGGTVLANACGPCIGQWKRTDLTKDEENSILTSFNRNFRARNDGFAGTMNFLAAPEIVTAVAFSGKLSFNPVTDSLVDPVTGKPWKFEPPKGDDLPSAGFEKGRETYSPPPAYPTPDAARKIAVDPKSTRLQLLDPFSPWDGKELTDLRVLVKAKGKCTTDHISAAGKWLKYKGHLQNISENTLIGAQNAFNGKVNMVKNLTNGKEDTIPNVAKDYKSKGVGWIVVADHNYGEGSAREHGSFGETTFGKCFEIPGSDLAFSAFNQTAAMQPRYLGARLIVSRSFARIHETNLKKQGVIPITFADPASYDLIPEDAVIQTVGLSALAPGSKVVLVVTGGDGKTVKIDCVHTLSEDQIGWIRAGSALNRVKELQNK